MGSLECWLMGLPKLTINLDSLSSSAILYKMNKKIKIELELSAAAVEKIERLNGVSLKKMLECEINENVDTFIELMGYDNY